VVLKPSEVAPLDAFILAEVIHDAGLPAGVFNLVVGTGPVVGEAIVLNPQIDMVSFTGSTRAGKRVAELAAQSLKRVALELGGKSANVLLDDLDDAGFEKAVRDGVGKCYINQGQTCTALTRMLVPESRVADAERIAADEVEANYQPSDPFADGARLGPLSSQAQVERVTGYIQKGIDEGARLVVGGPERPEGFDEGYYVRPTVFSDVSNDMTIAQEEIFGPVLSIIGYEDEDQAARIANDSVYGLSGGVWAADAERAQAFARRIRTGQIEVNGGAFNPNAPFGGYKNSGYGREYGQHGFEEFLEIKAMQL
jgi:acyl-CoA reductase-like NAD-dependent aldehyde dehydrogenase